MRKGFLYPKEGIMETEIIRLKRILTRKKEELLIDTNNDLYVSKLKFQIRELERMIDDYESVIPLSV